MNPMLRRGVIAIVGPALIASGIVGLTSSASAAPDRAAAAAHGLAWVRTASAASMRTAHGPEIRFAPRANDAEDQQVDHLVPAGHLGGRAHPVVLDIRETEFGIGSGTVGITARAGSTGHAYWHVTYPGSYQDGLDVLVEPLGAKGTPGVLVEQFTSMPDTVHTGDSDEDLTVTARSGATGSVLFTQTFNGVYDPTLEESSNVARNVQPFRDASHKAIDFLVPLDTSLSSTEEQVQGIDVSGVDGTPHDFGGTFTTSNIFPTENVVPDLNRDGLDDVVVDSPGSNIQAVSGKQPADQLWSSSAVLDGTPAIGAIADYSHPHVPDIWFATIQSGQEHEAYTVLSGLHGTELWQRHADALMRLGKAGPNNAPAVMLASRSYTTSTAKDTTTWHYAAITASNKVLYSKKVTGTIDNPASTYFSHVTIGAIGDVNGDGTADVHVTIDREPEFILVATGGPSTPKPVVHAKDGIINGRNGDFHSVVFDSPADGSLRKGSLTDLLLTHAEKGETRLAGFHGSTRKRYYSRLVHTLSDTGAAWSAGARLTGHSCSDIALIAETKVPNPPAVLRGSAEPTIRAESAVLSARGARLWTITYPVKDATGGTLTVYKKPKQYCV